jgi:LCP family protein required for cell wall assembly
MPKRFALSFLILILLTSCNLPLDPTALPTQGPVPTSSPSLQIFDQLLIATQDPDATTTTTPFQPAAPTTTSTPTRTPTPKPTRTPTLIPLPKKPSEVNPEYSGSDLTPPDGQVRVLVLGSDARAGGGFRTDVIMLVTINPNGTGSVVSFPRDLWVFIPGFGEQRINTAFEFMGIEGVYSTLEYNFGVRPDHYVMTNFNGFVEIIDSLEGIDVYASDPLTDKCDVPGHADGYCTVEPGLNHMDCSMALWYVRSRYSSSDFDRTRRAQEVIQGVFFRLLRLNIITKIKQIYNAYKQNVETDLSLGDIIPMLPLAPSLSKTEHVRRYAIGPGQVWDYIVPGSGAMVLVPNLEACRAILREAMAP